MRNDDKKRRIVKRLLVAAFWLILWELVFLAIGQELLFASPIGVIKRLFELMGTAKFYRALEYSLFRVLSGFIAAVVAGTALAVLTSASGLARAVLSPALGAIKATPVASFIILALVWMKAGSVPVFTTFLMVLPIIWANVEQGIFKADKKLLEMARMYSFGMNKTIRLVYLPQIMPYFSAAITSGMGLGWKAGVAAEVICLSANSIGLQLYNAKIYLETTDLFAWTAAIIALSMLLEAAVELIARKMAGYAGRGRA